MNIAALRSQRRELLAVVRSAQHARRYATPVAYESKEKDPQLGDYPQLPDVSRQYLPPTGWWDNQMRRDFGDTVRCLSDSLSLASTLVLNSSPAS